ncbi:MAG: Ig-like domain-containing protein [Bacteroidota bacterium]
MKNLFWVIVLFVYASCANVVAPMGGPADLLPPTVVSSTPVSGSVNFLSKEITIRFNEFIQLKDVNKSFLISPPMAKAPDFKIKGKSLKIVFKDSLRANTTYTLNFGGAIADLNEANVLAGYQYTFSTGSSRDTLTIGGNIQNAFSLNAEADVLVMLYRAIQDSIPYKKIPDFISKTNSTGDFSFIALPAGVYKIFAIRDKDADYLFSQPGEEISFLDSLVVPVPRDTGRRSVIKSRYELFLFKEELKRLFLLGKSASAPGRFQLYFNKRADSVQFYPLQKFPEGTLLTEWNTGHDTLTGWITKMKLDTLRLGITGPTGLSDTLELPFTISAKAQRMGKGVAEKKSSFKSPAQTGFQDATLPLQITFNNPVDSLFQERMFLSEENDTVPFKVFFTDSLKRNFQLLYKWKEGKRYRFIANAGAFTDILALRSDSIKLNFNIRNPKDFGLLRIVTDPIPAGFILQLLTEKNDIVREVISDGKTTFEMNKILPGKYKLKLIADEDHNGRWTTGNYLRNIQPEKVFLNAKQILIKPDWDTEVEWRGNFIISR